MKSFGWLALALTALVFARTLERAELPPDFWGRVAGSAIITFFWVAFVVCVVRFERSW